VEDIVAVRATLETGEARYFLTWGRVMDAVDPGPIEKAVRNYCNHVDLGGKPISVELCDSLQMAAGERYFYEHFFKMTQKKIPVGPEYSAWAAEVANKIRSGREIYYLGRY
jgi:hypothetical protein